MRNWGSTVVRILLLCLVVGLIISIFDISPEGVLGLLGSTVERIFSTIAGVVQWAVPYMLIGAVVVIPIWVVVYIIRVARSRYRQVSGISYQVSGIRYHSPLIKWLFSALTPR